MSRAPFPPVPGGYPFPRLELETLRLWRERNVFRRSVHERPAGRVWTFYEGPPTANNVPHVGHVVTRAVKDLFPRFQTMRGHRVPRKAGWDTHGLAVEIEVEKRLGFSGKGQIEAYGIAEFNAACLESVHTYERQWRAMTERVGYWIDMDDPYFTYSNEYIESVWWSLRRLWDGGLLLQDYKIQPYCARCGTTLSSHEVAQNYKEADDPSVWVLFPARPGQRVRSEEAAEVALDEVRFVAWTTTPWSLLGHFALTVHPDMVYRIVEHPERPGERLLFGDALETPVPLDVAGEGEGKRRRLDLRDLPVLARVRGAELEGVRYDRPFRTGAFDREPGETVAAFRSQPPSDEHGWRVALGDYVTASEGTGVVHTAPFGEDDYRTALAYALPFAVPIGGDGRVLPKPGIEPFAGLWFKDADGPILRDLRGRGLLLHGDRYHHNYPFCWRCDTPLLYYASLSWFVKTTLRRDELVAKNRAIEWHPLHVGEGRFGNWLENVVDWALSRKRYWGTPLPIWRCEACGAQECIGSYAELFARSGQERPADLYDRTAFDPHRPFVDTITLPCATPACAGTLRRVEEVIDAWYDSGSMPFAQHHYMGRPVPGFNPVAAHGPLVGFPADFISEAIDQTRGWFYTLHALGVLLFGSEAFESCVVLGHVTDEKGRKMSKRLGNVVEPMAVIEETGADALRWYFYVNNPEQSSRFSAALVREAAQGFLLPLWNALSFFTIYANLDGWRPGDAAPVPVARRAELDQWILLRLDALVAAVTAALEAHEIAPAAREIERFVDDLTNWYIRRSRGRFWSAGAADPTKESAYQTLHETLVVLTHLIAPFVPFVAETLHAHLVRSQDAAAPESVHLAEWPEPAEHEARLGEDAARLTAGIALVQRIVGLGRAARNTHELKTRQPLAGVTLVAREGILDGEWLARFGGFVEEELNVKAVRLAARRGDFVHHEVRPNFRVLGKRLGPRMPALKAALEASDGDALAAELERQGFVEVAAGGEAVRLESGDVEVRLVEKEGLATAADRELLVALDTALTPELVAEGWAREAVHRLQAARKDADLDYADRIRVRYRAAPELAAALAAHRDWIAGETLAVELAAADGAEGLAAARIDEHDFAFAIERVES